MGRKDQQALDERPGFRFSANRGKASHRVRYVEGTAANTGDCRLCQTALSPAEPEAVRATPPARSD